MYRFLRHAGAVLWQRRPIQLTFFVTRRCNASCPYCFYPRSPDRSAEAAPELSLEEIGRTASSLGPLLWLAFSGGEPYLRKDLAEVARIFHAQNRPAVLLISTNGLLPETITAATEEILAHCPRSIVVVKLSLDGLQPVHDAVRQTPGGFERVMQTYRSLGRLLGKHPNFELGINTVFCSGNQERIDELIGFVQRLEHVRTHTISLARGNLASAHCKDIDYGRYWRALDTLERNLKSRASPVYGFRGARLKAAQDIVQRRLIHQTALQQRRLTPCYAGRLNLVLSETGQVYPCETLSASWGNVREFQYDLAQVADTERARAAKRSIRAGACHCTHECYFLTNILFNPRRYPALAREYLSLLRAGH
jgi:MoaA/NifB/PqqE/SkfB family radical SAM enzyme